MPRLIHLVGKTTHTRRTVLSILQRGMADQPGRRHVLPVDDAQRWADAEIRAAWPDHADDVIVLAPAIQPRHRTLAPGDVLLVAHIERA